MPQAVTFLGYSLPDSSSDVGAAVALGAAVLGRGDSLAAAGGATAGATGGGAAGVAAWAFSAQAVGLKAGSVSRMAAAHLVA